MTMDPRLDPGAPRWGNGGPAGAGNGGVQVIDLGNGSSLVIYADPTGKTPPFQQVVSNKSLSGGTGAYAQAAAIRAAESRNALAENARQFNEQFGMDKAKFNTQFAENKRQFDAQHALDLFKYYADVASNPRNYALNYFLNRGQTLGIPASVRAMGNTNMPLGQVVGQAPGLTGGGVAGGASAGVAAPAPQPSPIPGAAQIAQAQQNALAFTSAANALKPGTGIASTIPLPNVGVGGSAPNLKQPTVQIAKTPTGQTQLQMPQSTGAVGVMPTNAVVVNAQTGANGMSIPISLSDWAMKNGANIAPFADGGVVPEPVIGIGMMSKQPYMFGENGPEGVVPTDALPDFLKSRTGQQVMGGRAYATGGLVGYDPSQDTTMLDAGMYGTPYQSQTISADQSAQNPYSAYGDNAAGIPGGNPFQQLAADNALPPFLQRVYGQQAGNASVGTNTPQRFALPQGVPLVSSMAYAQMSPSEQQALLSLISASGIDPQDYLAQIQMMNPGGAPSLPQIAYTGQ